MTTATCPAPLSETDLAAFARDGYLIARGVFDANALANIHADLDRAISRKAEALHAAGTLRDLHQDKPFSQRFGFLMAQDPAIQHGFDIQHLRTQALFEVFHHQPLLDRVEALIGGEISANPIHHIRAKPPQHQTAAAQRGYFSVPWHQDSGVNVAEADGSDILTTWVALVDVDEVMGCVQVIPGVNHLGHLRHVASKEYGTSIAPELLPRTKPVKCVMRAGDVLIMHRHCPHHSTPNRSDRCRWSLDLRFHRTGHNSGRPWQPEFVVRSRSGEHGVMRDHGTWDRLWAECLARPDGGRVVHRVE